MKKIKVVKVMQNVEDKYRAYLKKLRRERDQLAEEVASQAQCNYAREPKFVKDRWRLRQLSGEVAQLLRQVNKPLAPIVSELMREQRNLNQAAKELEDESEMVVKRFEQGQHERAIDERENDDANVRPDQKQQQQQQHQHQEHLHQQQVNLNNSRQNGAIDTEWLLLEEFLKDYVEVRKKMHVKHALANRLSNELACYESSWKSFATKPASCAATTTKVNPSKGANSPTATMTPTTGCHSPIRRGKHKER